MRFEVTVHICPTIKDIFSDKKTLNLRIFKADDKAMQRTRNNVDSSNISDNSQG